LLSLALGFQAGDVFRLTYGEFPYPQGYSPRGGEIPNGGRWEGVVVTPEPAGAMLACFAVSVGWRHSRRSSRHCPRQRPLPL